MHVVTNIPMVQFIHLIANIAAEFKEHFKSWNIFRNKITTLKVIIML